MNAPVSVQRAVRAIPVLRSLDSAGRELLIGAAQWRARDLGAPVFSSLLEAHDAMVGVLRGRIELRANDPAGDCPRTLRTIQAGDVLGEAALAGLAPRVEAVCLEPSEVLVWPASLFVRAATRAGEDSAAAIELSRLRRAAMLETLTLSVLHRCLSIEELPWLIDAARWLEVARGEPVYEAGDTADAVYVLAEGLVQLQTGTLDLPRISAHHKPGDVFGVLHIGASMLREHTAVAVARSIVLRLSRAAWQTAVDRNRALVEFVDVPREQAVAVPGGDASNTRHVFRDLHRFATARSLLVIDQDACVRCGHCTWSCAAAHDGVPRMVRRGDVVVASLRAGVDEASPTPLRHLLVPNACQHCRDPVCMVDCPTGAIGRHGEGDVFIRESLCTGCGNCAKACPWDNIRLAPRRDVEALVAVKCDLCAGRSGPECVRSCPTGALARVDPRRAFGDLGAWLEAGAAELPKRPVSGSGAKRLLQGVGLAVVMLGMTRGWGRPGDLAWAIPAALGCVSALAYAIPKRAALRWRWQLHARSDVPEAESKPASMVRPWLSAHVWIGAATSVAVLAHAGRHFGPDLAGLLHAAFWATIATGAFGLAVYRWVPRWLTRLERDGVLVEELDRRRDELLSSLRVALGRASGRVRRASSRVLGPYLRSWTGIPRMLWGGGDQATERHRVATALASASEREADDPMLTELALLAVELRLVGWRRAFTRLLRAWLGPHIALAVWTVSLLLLHVIASLERVS